MVRIVHNKRRYNIEGDDFIVYNLMRRGYSLEVVVNVLYNMNRDELKYEGRSMARSIRYAKRKVKEIYLYGEEPPEWFRNLREINMVNYEKIMDLIKGGR